MRQTILVTLLCIIFSYASAQEVYNSSGKPGYHKKTKKSKGYDPSKLVLGGGLNAAYGGGYAVAGISPLVGYQFFNHFSAGVGLGYLYSQQPDGIFSNAYTTYYDREHIIYPNLWARYIVFRGLYVTSSFEYDIIKLSQPNVDFYGNMVTDKLNVNAECLLLGLGVKQPLSGRVSFFVEGMYDVLQQQYSPYYRQPVFRAGVCAGL